MSYSDFEEKMIGSGLSVDDVIKRRSIVEAYNSLFSKYWLSGIACLILEYVVITTNRTIDNHILLSIVGIVSFLLGVYAFNFINHDIRNKGYTQYFSSEGKHIYWSIKGDHLGRGLNDYDIQPFITTIEKHNTLGPCVFLITQVVFWFLGYF